MTSIITVKEIKFRLNWRTGILFFVFLFFLGFSIYLGSLFQQLEKSFFKQEQFIPTKIYSDVTRLAPPQIRGQILTRLKSLGSIYVEQGEKISLNLNPIEYPIYLLPDNHPTLEAAGKTILLQFDNEDWDGALHSIQIDGVEVPEIFLEPELVATLTRGDTKEIRSLIQFKDIPAPIWKSIIAVEDQHFLDHKGFDPRGIARALWVNLRTLSFAQGGSTITQQLVKNLTARRGRNLFRKMNELFLALLLELRFDKEQILERYLNEVYLGQVGNLEVHGVTEGAKHFFGKKLHELNLAEAALIAGLIRGPAYYSPYRHRERALERLKLVFKRMVETGQIAEEEAKEALQLPIRLIPPQATTNKAPHFTDFVKAELIRVLKDKMTEQEITSAGFRVYTTLDVHLNLLAQKAVSQEVLRLEKQLKLKNKERLEGALAAVDHQTGFIRTLIGGRNYSESTFNRILNMKRQVGSTFKPFVYLAALLKGKDPRGIPYGPGYPVEDAQWTLTYDNGKQTWSPKNYEKEHLGWTSFRAALAQSINVATAKIGTEIGLETIQKTAQDLGIELELPLVPSLTLGVSELSPVELLKAYATLANHGTQDELTVIRGITTETGSGYARFIYHPQMVIPPGPADLLIDMLQSVFSDGTARAAFQLGFDRPAAGKTGTTSNHRDAWFAGFTPQLTTVVWVGLDYDTQPFLVREKAHLEKPRVFLTGASSALPIWVQFMKDALQGEPLAPFPISPHLTSVRIDSRTGITPTSDCPLSQIILEKFVIGNEPE